MIHGRQVIRLIVLSEWADVLEPTRAERSAWRHAVAATLSPDTVGLTRRRMAEIAAWLAHEQRITDPDRSFLRWAGIEPPED